ncbi:MAG: class II aldolase/adducin family protein, partial [Planctomycetes bacterium]|nr:class II aldolase/adducin family protein [Planctomycetota bacterium]
EILDAYCRILLLAKQMGNVNYFSEKETTELLGLKQKLGFDDPRFHVENCDLCGNSAFRDGYKEQLPQQRAFEPAPSYPGYLQSKNTAVPDGEADVDELVKTITDQVMASMQS